MDGSHHFHRRPTGGPDEATWRDLPIKRHSTSGTQNTVRYRERGRLCLQLWPFPVLHFPGGGTCTIQSSSGYSSARGRAQVRGGPKASHDAALCDTPPRCGHHALAPTQVRVCPRSPPTGSAARASDEAAVGATTPTAPSTVLFPLHTASLRVTRSVGWPSSGGASFRLSASPAPSVPAGRARRSSPTRVHPQPPVPPLGLCDAVSVFLFPAPFLSHSRRRRPHAPADHGRRV